MIASCFMPGRRRPMSRRPAMTLVEVLVVLGILAAMMALSLPAIMKAREAALRAESMNNLKQIVVAIHNFAATNGDQLPSIDGNKRSANRGVSLWGAHTRQAKRLT